MRPWMQAFLYYGIAKALGIRDTFRLAFVFRLVTGIASWGALVLFVKTTLPWLEDEGERRLHLRVATLLGFLPYLFVRTSSETFAMLVRWPSLPTRKTLMPSSSAPTTNR